MHETVSRACSSCRTDLTEGIIPGIHRLLSVERRVISRAGLTTVLIPDENEGYRNHFRASKVDGRNQTLLIIRRSDQEAFPGK